LAAGRASDITRSGDKLSWRLIAFAVRLLSPVTWVEKDKQEMSEIRNNHIMPTSE
jgi:hypothetical protein